METVLPGIGDDAGALLRINLTYLWRHRRLPNLADPTLFTELVQLRKLRDRDLRMPAMADKVAVKALVAARLGRAWVVPTLWHGTTLPEQSRWTSPIVVKSRHGCNQNLFLPDGGAADWPAVWRQAAGWLGASYGGWLDEWLYTQIPRGALIEPFVGTDGQLPIDYKFYVFGGRVSHVQVHLDRAHDHRWVVHDSDWVPLANGAPRLPRPSALREMIAAAEELASNMDFARVDLYQPGAQPLFGEVSFYPGSGLDRFDPPALDAAMGALWLRAGGHRLVTRQPAPTAIEVAV
ncbi:ATP-grasp fold amidoligase family protein [Sphingomonas hylomeconis]|uniref:ATP-grasp fold amidoligase family protein n=1 Tax=Sphingomonas hylomeconis TaxID=1395958 RepID=A0ABV7T0P1_9SPHN|nr:ATP-grasp fold amidoligase family protein [Sphingomonas hylomeconis]